MIKRPFLTFITVVSILIAGLLWFIQSSSFAKVFKSVAARYIPKDTGVFADFSEFSIQLFPPGFSVRNPKVHFGARNITSIPEGSSVSVERIDFIFRPFQIFSGNIRIHQVHIVNGAVQLWLDPASLKKKPKTKTKRLDLHWDELLQIRADSIALENIDLKILFSDSPQVLNSSVKFLSLAQGSGRGGPGYLVHLSLEKIEGSYLKTLGMPESLPQLRCDAYMNASGLQLENLILEGEGIEVNASGLVRGSLLDLKSAEAEANLKVKGDLTSITRKYFPTVVSLRDLTGAFSWVGKVTAKLDRFLESVHAEGHGSIRNFSYQNWKSDRVEVEAQWLPESVSGGTPVAGGELHLSRLTFVSKMLPRMGGFQPGDGGKIEIGPTRWSPGSPLPVTVPIAFEGAHLHWVGAAALKYVYPLDFRLNGNIQATFQPPVGHKSWELGVQFNNAWL